MTSERILVVDDEDSVRYVLETFLKRKGCEVVTAGTAEQALEKLDESPPAVALLDIVLPGMNGIQLLGEIKARSNDSQVVMMTSHGSMETAVGAIHHGAFDYLQKPFENLEEIWTTVQRALEKRSVEMSSRELVAERSHRSREISETVDRLQAPVVKGENPHASDSGPRSSRD